MRVFDYDWFKLHQRRLVRFANTYLGKCVFGLPKDEMILSISPGGYSRLLGIDPEKGIAYCEHKTILENEYAFRLQKYGKPVWMSMHFLDWLALDRQQLVPNFGFATYTASIDASGRSGLVARDVYGSSETWSAIVSGVGNYISTSNPGYNIQPNTTQTNKYNRNFRGYMMLDFTGLKFIVQDTAKITATLYYGSTATGSPSGVFSNRSVVITTFAPDNAYSIVATDYDTFGYSYYTDETHIPHGYTTDQWNSIALNTNFKSQMYSGFFGTLMGLGVRCHGDAYGETPTWSGSIVTDSRSIHGYGQTYAAYVVIGYTTGLQINIGDTWRDVADLQINIGDIWKSVRDLNLNISDVWKNRA